MMKKMCIIYIIGESELDMKLCIALHVCIWLYVGIYVSAVHSYTREYMEDFMA